MNLEIMELFGSNSIDLLKDHEEFIKKKKEPKNKIALNSNEEKRMQSIDSA